MATANVTAEAATPEWAALGESPRLLQSAPEGAEVSGAGGAFSTSHSSASMCVITSAFARCAPFRRRRSSRCADARSAATSSSLCMICGASMSKALDARAQNGADLWTGQ